MNEENKKYDGSGWFQSGNKWWAVVREGTVNILQGTYDTEAEARSNYTAYQARWDKDRVSCVKWKQGKNRYGDR
tara:strand:- start:178 stop:399 length:222 start_codon:yes stop_codon:yes gene_type:complete